MKQQEPSCSVYRCRLKQQEPSCSVYRCRQKPITQGLWFSDAWQMASHLVEAQTGTKRHKTSIGMSAFLTQLFSQGTYQYSICLSLQHLQKAWSRSFNYQVNLEAATQLAQQLSLPTTKLYFVEKKKQLSPLHFGEGCKL